MKKVISSLKASNFKTSFLLLITVFISLLLISPKWNIGIFAFIAFAAILRFFRNAKWWQAIILTWFVTVSATFIANLGVMPFPPPIMIRVIVIGSTWQLIPFLLDKLLFKRLPGVLSTFIFPAAVLAMNIFNGSEGTFGHIAYTMVDFNALMQITSVTGIWGVAFLIYWFAAVINQIIDCNDNVLLVKRLAITYSLVFSLAVLFGFARLYTGNISLKNAPTTRLAAITTENSDWIVKAHLAMTGENLILPKKLDQTSREVAIFQSSLGAFMTDHNNPKFDSVQIALGELTDEIFKSCKKAVDEGAQAILLSEAVIFTFADKEAPIIDRAKSFARNNQVYLFFAIATIYPEKMMFNQPFIGNKVLSIDPNGEILRTYYKNSPVDYVEPSIPGDGVIHVVKTPHGNLSPIICYDADFPKMLRQTGNNGTDIIMVATADWYSISPYHSEIGKVRSIENGVSMVKAVSKGLSIAADPYGRILNKDDYYKDTDHVMITDVPVKPVKTIYSKYGDVILILCQIYILAIFVYMIWYVVKRFFRKKELAGIILSFSDK